MTATQRHTAILGLIDSYTIEKTVNKRTARKALIDEGIYTKNGVLSPEFGGPDKKVKAKT